MKKTGPTKMIQYSKNFTWNPVANRSFPNYVVLSTATKKALVQKGAQFESLEKSMFSRPVNPLRVKHVHVTMIHFLSQNTNSVHLICGL